MKKYLKFLTPIVIIIVICLSIHKINVARAKVIKKFDKEYSESKKSVKKALNEVTEDTFDESLEIPSIEEENEEPKYEPLEVIEEEPVVEEVQEVESSYTTRMTSYYPEEGETITASGLGINNFQVNNKGWFTYNCKLVVATASNRLGSTSMKTYNLYDEVIINIEGTDYEAIVLDVCGACQRSNRIDLFASSMIYAKDTNVIIK